MPHVQIRGACRLADLRDALAGFLESAPPEILKLQGAYLDSAAGRLLFEAVVVEGYLRQNFFLLVREEEGAVLIRCHPFSNPQKTPGVKRLIARVALRCLQACPGAEIGNTNLRDFLAG